MVQNFCQIPLTPKPEFLFGLPIDDFIHLLQSDELNVSSEFELVDIVKKCLAFHSEKGEKLSIPPIEAATPEVWNRLSEYEKKHRQEIYEKELKSIADTENAKKQEEIKIYH